MMSRRLTGLLLLGLVILFTPGARPAQAQNLLSNPTFDTVLTGWDVAPTTVSFDATMGAASGPGSALWEETIVEGSLTNEFLIASQCVDGIVAGSTYAFGGAIRLATAPVGGSTVVVVAWQSGGGCSGFFQLDAATPVSTVSPSFQTSSGTAVAPPGAVSAEVVIVGGIAPLGPGTVDLTEAAFVAGDYAVNVDDMFLLQQEPVPTAGVLWSVVLAAALAAAAIRRLRQRIPYPA